jgi:hypothetical protein
MKRLTNSKKLLAALGAGLLVTAASGTAFAMQTREAHDLRARDPRATIEVQQKASERHGQAPVSASPLPTPTLPPTAEPRAGIQFTGQIEVIASDMWVVGGRTLIVTADTEIKPGLAVGDQAKVHAVTQADGTLWAREIEPADDDQGNGNSNDNENSNDDQGDDDHGGNVNSNENRNDDHDGNGNENHNDNVNSNDDHGDHNGNGNSNDDQGGGDHGGNINSNDGHGRNDHGGTHNGNHGSGNHGSGKHG